MNITELIRKYEAMLEVDCDPSLGRYDEFSIELLELVNNEGARLYLNVATCSESEGYHVALHKALEELRKL